ncbi:MAG: septation protein IspZ [Oligoflexia bacterium]|nr:septation protein IspZ [Oligoflexia bacterium]
MKALSKLRENIFLTSFLPILAYWYLEANYPLRVAILGGILLALLEIAWEWYYNRKLHLVSKINFYLMVIMGGLALLENDGVWFKLSPAITLAIMGGLLGGDLYLKKRVILLEMMKELSPKSFANPKLPLALFEHFIASLQRDLAILMLLYGVALGLLGIYATTAVWAFAKTIGFYIVLTLFMLGEFFFLRLKLKRLFKGI